MTFKNSTAQKERAALVTTMRGVGPTTPPCAETGPPATSPRTWWSANAGSTRRRAS